MQVSDDRAEAELVVQQIQKECTAKGYAFNDVAIFYRTNAQSRVFEDVLRRDRIPYKVIGGLRFYDRKEIKDVLAYLKVLMNSEDSISLKRIINVPQRAIGKTTVDKVEDFGFQKQISFYEALKRCATTDGEFNSGTRKKLADFVTLLDDLKMLMGAHSLSELYHELLDRTKYVQELKLENSEESLSRIENLQELDSTLVEFEEEQKKVFFNSQTEVDLSAKTLLPVFLESVTLASDQDQVETEAGSISMMTLHTSKGLEFPLVFIVGMEEGLFPSIRPNEVASEEDIEEERRLCYVGMTRAREKLYLSHAVCRRIYGNIVYHDPARFLSELPEEYVRFSDLSRFRMRSYAPESVDESSDVPSRQIYADVAAAVQVSKNVGKKVRHETYGIGVIKSEEGAESDRKVTVEFSNRVTKKFVLKFVQLEYLN